MATITAQFVIGKVALQLQDEPNVHWERPELLGWINSGQREAVIIKPTISAKSLSVELTAGVTKQEAPADSYLLIDVLRNMGSNGSTPGDVIRMVTREAMDAIRPTWHSDPPVGKIKNYTLDPRTPNVFYVYPKAPPSAWFVELVYSSLPTDVVAESDAIGIDDIYADALIDYVLYRAYSKESDYASHAPKAASRYVSFRNAFGATA